MRKPAGGGSFKKAGLVIVIILWKYDYGDPRGYNQAFFAMDMCGTHVESETMTVSCSVMIYNVYICIHIIIVYIYVCIGTPYSQLTEWLGVVACVSSIRMWLDNAAFGS